VAHA